MRAFHQSAPQHAYHLFSRYVSKVVVSLSETTAEAGRMLQESLARDIFSDEPPADEAESGLAVGRSSRGGKAAASAAAVARAWPRLIFVTSESKQSHSENNNAAAAR